MMLLDHHHVRLKGCSNKSASNVFRRGPIMPAVKAHLDGLEVCFTIIGRPAGQKRLGGFLHRVHDDVSAYAVHCQANRPKVAQVVRFHAISSPSSLDLGNGAITMPGGGK